MKQYQDLLDSLDTNQRAAATVQSNAVIAAGAGSGKTRVLSARFVHLIVERGFTVDQILTLTFTTKAAAEMYSRIHATLQETDHPNAKKALESFHLAKIQTIDSFCNAIARSSCRAWGVSPDYSIEAEQAQILADTLALTFFLEHRTSGALAHLLKNNTMASLPSDLFAKTMIRYSPLSAPLDFAAMFEIQSREIEHLFRTTLDEAFSTLATMGTLKAESKTLKTIQSLLEKCPDRPDSTDRAGIIAFLRHSASIAAVRQPGNVKQDDMNTLKELMGQYRDHIHPVLCSTCNYLLNRSIIAELFSLLDEFQTLFNQRKREAGILTFTDVSRMAVDTLINDPDLRCSYKSELRAIMIDEFQDDNELQKDLLFLLAEQETRREQSLPRPEDLSPGKLFFVGDEKQSIYRFRGADVSVFRSLAQELGDQIMPRLDTNYRTETPLLDFFNTLFPAVFLDGSAQTGQELPLYEARFVPINPFQNTPGVQARAEIMLAFTPDPEDENADALDQHEAEAEAVARTIAQLIATGYPVRNGTSVRPVRSDDIAILFRSSGRQFLYERFLRQYGIPSQSESLSGLFSDAPVNDLYCLLRLAVFPGDNLAYAALLRSPFVAVSDEAFTAAMLDRQSGQEGTAEPFCEKTLSALSGRDREQFLRGRTLYRETCAQADRIPVASLVSDLWYRMGYRYGLLAKPSISQFAELYDYFFELARQADERNEPIAVFLDTVADTMESGEKISGLDIPVERTGGVRLMTIHKSKGLEFPVVFLVDASNIGKADNNSEPVYFSGESGLSLNTAPPDDCEEAENNWFFERDREEERNKKEAELRRLLYVALTRAETALFISGKIRKELDPECDVSTPEGIRTLLDELEAEKVEKASKPGKRRSYASFLDLLLPAISRSQTDDLTITVIGTETDTAGKRAGHAAPGSGASEQDYSRLAGIPVSQYARMEQTRFPATALHALLQAPLAEPPATPPAAPPRDKDTLDRLLDTEHLSAAEFGTIAHRAIESRFTGIPAAIPAGVAATVEKMVSTFFSSSLGTMAQKSRWREAEYSFITRIHVEGNNLVVSGQADLVFEHEGTIHIVDYKTDARENPENHRIQLEIYRKAMGDILKKPVKTWIYYLRSGNAAEVVPAPSGQVFLPHADKLSSST